MHFLLVSKTKQKKEPEPKGESSLFSLDLEFF